MLQKETFMCQVPFWIPGHSGELIGSATLGAYSALGKTFIEKTSTVGL